MHGVLKPPPLHCVSPLKPHKSCCHCCLIWGHVSKDMFFFFFISFLTSVAETSFPHMLDPQTPPLHHASPLKPCKSRHCHCLIHGHTSKDMFFFFSFLFIPFLTNVTETLYPTCQVLKPPPLHHIIPTPVLCPQALQVLPPPLPTFAGMQVKISFFLLFSFLF